MNDVAKYRRMFKNGKKTYYSHGYERNDATWNEINTSTTCANEWDEKSELKEHFNNENILLLVNWWRQT